MAVGGGGGKLQAIEGCWDGEDYLITKKKLEEAVVAGAGGGWEVRGSLGEL